MIELDFSNMMEEMIGDNGLPENLIKNFNEAYKAHEQIEKRLWPELAFIDLLYQDTSEIKNLSKYIRENALDFLLLGIGGSALGPKAILEALSPFHNLQKKPRVFIYDNIDPRTLHNILSCLDLKTTFINVISKSGSTAETAASFMVLWEKMNEVLGSEAPNRFIITTDPETGNLRRIVREYGMASLSIPPGVVGRYSVLSPVGLLMAEIIGGDSNELLHGARDLHKVCSTSELLKNPAYIFSTLLYLMYKEKGRIINVLMPYADSLKSLSEWFCQIWAESLGKENKGPTPYPSLGSTDQHSQLQLWMQGPHDKVIIFIKIRDYGIDITIPEVFKEMEGLNYLSGHTLSSLIQAEQEATELALAKAKRPSMTIVMPAINGYYLGQLFHFFELSTTFAGFLYGINPFNQPGVEEGKNLTYGIMGKKGFEEKKKEVEAYRRKKDRWII